MGWAQSPRHQRPVTHVVRMDDINHGHWILFDTRHARLRPSAVAVGYLDGNAFAEKLERAIARSDRARLIEGKAIEVEDR